MNRKRLNTLIKRAIAGEAIALEQLCQMYAKTILFQARLLVRNKDEAEDVAQRVAIEMLRGIQKLRSPYAFRSWLQRLIVNACNKQNARTQQETERTENLDSFVDSFVDESLEARPEESLASKDLQRYVGGYLDRLSPAQAVALTLYYYEQLSYKEVADAMGISVGAVSSTISKAKMNLRTMLKERNDPSALGIVFLPPIFRGGPERVVRDEINSSVSVGAVERFMAVCKTNIAAIATSAGTAVVTTGTWGAVLATALGIALLGGAGAATIALLDTPESNIPVIEEAQPVIIPPDSRVTYSVAGEQLYDDPRNPLTVQFSLLTGEQVEGWILTDSAGTELALGGGYAGNAAGTPADGTGSTGSGVAQAIADGTFIDISSLGLADGEYTLSWYLIDRQGGKSRAYWDFFITSNP
jgi:RNA polymerase sigma-70 factor (ECF subfamily)